MRKGFNLIELVLIMSVISAAVFFAIPVYTNYMNRNRIGQAVELLTALNKAAINKYNQQALGTTFTFDNIELSTTSTAFDYPPVKFATYSDPSFFSSGNQWMFCVNVSGLNFSGYQDPDAGGNYSRVCSKVKEDNGVFVTFCGRYANNITDIPVAELPEQCSCASISTESC